MQNETLEQYAVELQSLNAQLLELSNTDGLTSLKNRRHFDETMAVAWTRAKRSCAALTLFMIDVDFFKQFNDAHGHQAGDDCLKQVATVIRSCLRRADDYAARFGGEEFAVLTNGLTEAQAFDLGRSLLECVTALNIRHSKSPFGIVTVSAGFATLKPDQDNGSPDVLIKSADTALYRAKETGRNCVRSFADIAPHKLVDS